MSTEPLPRRKDTLADDLIQQIDDLLQEALASGAPLEVDPARSRLFELFVTADGAGYLREGADPDLTADVLCKVLAARWGLDEAARHSVEAQARLPSEHLAQMRILWSFLRMWMEWTYAWQRWEEFHDGP